MPSKQDVTSGCNKPDFGQASADYALYRPGPPDSFYEKLAALGVGVKNQRILDLGTGTGVFARRLAKQGAVVTGIDISAEQVCQARRLAAAENLQIDFRVSSAETTPFADHSFDVITALMCWHYLDQSKVIAEVRRLLVPGGVFVLGLFIWMHRSDPVAWETEKLTIRYNPRLTSGCGRYWAATGGNDGYVPPMPDWAINDFNLRGMFAYEEQIPFTHESWRGQVRARGNIGGSLSLAKVAAFDEEHAELLKRIVPKTFAVRHKMAAHILEFK